MYYSKNHITGARQNMVDNLVVLDVMLFKPFDWTMESISAFDWLSKYAVVFGARGQFSFYIFMTHMNALYNSYMGINMIHNQSYHKIK